MRCFPLPLVLAGLLGSAGLVPADALASPDNDDYVYASYGPPPRATYAALPANSYRYRSGYPSRYDNNYSNYSKYNNNYGGRYPNGYAYPIVSESSSYGPSPGRSCNHGTVLTGAAIGGGLGAMLATNSRNRLWSLPMGAAMGGILGGVMSGC